MDVIKINAVVPNAQPSPIDFGNQTFTPVIAPAVVPTGTSPLLKAPVCKDVLVYSDVGMLMNFSSELTSLALIAVCTAACQHVVWSPPQGTLFQCTMGNALENGDLVNSLADLYEPDSCSTSFTEMFCMCGQQGQVCRTCQTASETKALYLEILNDLITRTVFNFDHLPRGYSGPMSAEALSPDTILIRFP